MVVVTRCGAGPWGITAAGEAQVAAPKVEVADTVGAGDSFMAALLSGLVDRELVGGQYRHTLRSMPAEVLHALLEHAARAAAIIVSRPGANPLTRAELNGEPLNLAVDLPATPYASGKQP